MKMPHALAVAVEAEIAGLIATYSDFDMDSPDFARVGQRSVLVILVGPAYVSQDRNVYKDSCLHPTHCHNVDRS
jgi:hypothetical protein